MAFLRDLIESVMPTVAYAEEPEEEVVEVEEEVVEEPVEEATEDAAAEEDEEEEEEEDEDDEEEQDPLDKLHEECAHSKPCHEFKHHFDECVERVTKASEEEGYEHLAYKEDCVEEFFHLQHCVNDCAAPKLFYKLK